MHEITIPQWVYDTVMERRGTLHPHDDLDPAKTALIVVDLQNGFMMEGVAHALCETAREIVPNVNRIATALRQAGGKVYWIKNTHDESCLESWSNLHAMTPPAAVAKRVESMTENSVGHQIWDACDVRPEDEIVLKYRYSAFLPGSSDLAEKLKAEGIDTVIITGTVTNVCCESSARDAMMMNFRTIMVTDGNAAVTDEEHNAALTNFYLVFGDIMDTDYLLDRLSLAVASAA
ncbi:MAG: isochorismatase family cysteine hydrolase [Pseudomonadota bacterium]